jgi:nitroreductase
MPLEETMNEVLKTMAQRRSCRQFQPQQIKDDDLHLILQAGLQAPSGHNDQSVYMVVLQKPDLIDELSEGSKQEMQKMPIEWMANAGRVAQYNIYYRAPTVLIICARKDAISPVPDVSAAIENMMLAAQSLGYGSCWIGFTIFYFNDESRYQKLGIPEGYEVHYGLSLGFPHGKAPEAPARKYEPQFHFIR